MSFTAIFIALLIERFFDCSHLRHWGWYEHYQRWITQKLSGQTTYITLAAIVLPLVIAIVIIELLISDVAFGFLKLAFSIFIILYCFGPRNLWADTFASLNALSEGDAAAATDKLKIAFGVTNSGNSPDIHSKWINAIFIQANRRVFAMVFWFSFVGLFGVVLYRLLSLSSQVTNAARQAESYLDWPPVRVLTFIFALGGNYSKVFFCWRNKVLQGPETNDAMLTECGVASLTSVTQEKIPIDGSAEKEAINLLDRALAIVLVLVAVLVFLIP